MGQLVVVARYSYPLDAQIAKSNLEAAGINAYIADVHTINTNWLYSDALGGVRLMVDGDNVQEAEAILGQDFSQSVIEEAGEEDEEERSQRCCAYCGSNNVVPFTKGKRPAFVLRNPQ
ncbi:DUF2007 domain-containing protein [Jinshanibacter sp. LJY008]|uniref:DUF2007 domain-containing protein n=1 Tax=Limnobaculum eriocheiris TaxID=2897391 RepID=A0A9X1N0J6_9GAMM|nr:DUF2007 domain-containing protein [Limnobaculum eriocheiris]MCD1127590.1 DUF2007 domain-containing protein [Limnobaculum eriocheiris]